MGACEVRWACGCVAFRCGQATNTKDLYSADLLSYDSVSVRGLDNKKGQRGGEAGLVELYLFKRLARDYLCGKFMEDRHIGAEPKANIPRNMRVRANVPQVLWVELPNGQGTES